MPGSQMRRGRALGRNHIGAKRKRAKILDKSGHFWYSLGHLIESELEK
jgi:hypothetical protein